MSYERDCRTGAREIEIAWVEKTGHYPVGAMYEGIKHLFPVMARAALEAMRGPTKDMVRETRSGYPTDVWKSMVDISPRASMITNNNEQGRQRTMRLTT
jgi:hypothetical protein